MSDKPAIEFIARGLVRRDGRALLCRSVKHGHCYLPGGHVEPGEASEDALAREMLEETGLEIQVGRPLLIWEQRFVQRGKPRHEVTVVFHVEHFAPEVVPSREPAIEFVWATDADFAGLNVLPRAVAGWLRACLTPGWSAQTAAVGWISSRS